MAGSYQKDYDYSAAIAGTSDESRRQQLLAERQNKIESEGLGGKVAGNDAVSTWNGAYRPYSVSSTTTGGLQVSGLYSAAEQSRMRRFEAERARIAQRLQGNLSAIDADYTSGMTQSELNARRSVQGNEEKMAALGLNMGGRYDAATSGASETSRVAIDNQYRGDLNALGTARLSARAAAEAAAADQDYALQSDYYTGESDAALAQAQATLAQFNADRTYGLSVAGLSGFLNGTPTLDYRQYQFGRETAEQKAATEQKTQAYGDALDRWKTSGYVQPKDAAILGVPAGTPTGDTRYKNAYLSFQQWKAGM